MPNPGNGDLTFRENVLLNLGLVLLPADNAVRRASGYNLLGLFDEDPNKRAYINKHGNYRSHAPAIGISLTHAF